MLAAKNFLSPILQDIKESVVKSFINNNLSDIDEVYKALCEKYNNRADIDALKASIKGQILACMGFLAQEVDENRNLCEFA